MSAADQLLPFPFTDLLLRSDCLGSDSYTQSKRDGEQALVELLTDNVEKHVFRPGLMYDSQSVPLQAVASLFSVMRAFKTQLLP